MDETTSTPPLPWSEPAWQHSARAWMEASLAQLDRPPLGPPEPVHLRPWSTIWRVPTPAGPVYFKAAIPLLRREPALTRWLHARCPDHILPVLAADLEQGWMLVPDGGPLLRSYLNTPADLALVEPLLPALAELQIDLAGQADTLLDLVPFDRRPERLPALLSDLLADQPAMRIGQDDGLTAHQLQRLQGLIPRFQELCVRLAASPIPLSLHHDDFHDGNIFLPQPSQPAIFYDWGESCLAHPFFSIIILLRALTDRVGLPESAATVPENLHPALAHLRDRYLEPWEVFDSHANLVATFNLAWRAGMVNRALTWRQVVAAFLPAYQPQYAYAAPAWLGEFLELMEEWHAE